MRRSGEPRDLLRTADVLLGRADAATAGLWPRASAILGLQALEASLRIFWGRRAPDLAGCPPQVQLICLRRYLSEHEADLAARTRHTWAGLDRASHHHTYELAPTAGELRTWLSVVQELVERVEAG